MSHVFYGNSSQSMLSSSCKQSLLPCLLQVALNAVQRRLSSISAGESDIAAENRSLKGALQQASVQYKQLLEQYKLLQDHVASSNSSAVQLHKLQEVHKQVCQSLDQSQSQLQHSQQQLKQLQEQLQASARQAQQLQQVVDKLSKTVADMHAAIDSPQAAPEAQAPSQVSARHNLQAVHETVQNKLSRYGSKSSGSDFGSDELLLPALWRPQKERHIAPAGFR